MSGLGKTTTSSQATSDQKIDGILGARHWADPIITYSFPPNESYLVGYGPDDAEAIATFEAATSQQEDVIHFALSVDQGVDAADGFAIEGFTNRDFQFIPMASQSNTEHLRFAVLDQEYVGTAFAYYPFSDAYGGDVVFNHIEHRAPQAGDYSWLTHLHETGHALGLTHGHENEDGKGRLPIAFDEMQYTVMSYRSHASSLRPPDAYENADDSYAQTYMMLDIQALQHLYGANYQINSGDTVYSWQPDSGDTLINGAVAIDAMSQVVFMTIWDGGGYDIYDFSAYQDDLDVDLAPGSGTRLGLNQRADLLADSDRTSDLADYSVYNALLFAGDERSLIEAAIGAAGSDSLLGNTAGNLLRGNDGDDTLSGFEGNDALVGGVGADVLNGGRGRDVLEGDEGGDRLRGGNGDDGLNGGLNADILAGGNGNDSLMGGFGRDVLNGGRGVDTLLGGVGHDRFVFNATSGVEDIIRDFQDGKDLIVYSDAGLTFDDLNISQRGTNVLVDFGTSSALLRGTDLAEITADDFLCS